MHWYKKAQTYDDYRSRVQQLSSQNPYPFKEWFDENGRAYVPFITNQGQDNVDKSVQAELEENNYQITDYQQGYCVSGNRTFKISKVLNNLKKQKLNIIQQKIQENERENERDPIHYQINFNQLQEELIRTNKYYDELINTFINSSFRANQANPNKSEFSVVISQNPHDVAQMSTGRNWTSCMELGQGSHYEDVFCEVSNGGLVAYLVKSNDIEIENPLARIHIRRFDNKEGQSFAIPEKTIYGNEIEGFSEFVKQWLDQKQGYIASGMYERQGGEYSDTFGDTFLSAPTEKEDVIKWFKGEGKDAVYSTWTVKDLLYEEYPEENDRWGGDDYQPPDPIDNETKTFNTKEEALEYLNIKTKEDQQFGDYIREDIFEKDPSSTWNNKDEETGEWEEERYWLKENPTDHRFSMKKDAIRTILKSPKGEYPLELIEEIKQMFLNDKINDYSLRKNFFSKYPEIFSDEEIKELKDVDQLDLFKNLSPEKQEVQKQQWGEYIRGMLSSPESFITEDVKKDIGARDNSTDVESKHRYNDSIGLHYSIGLQSDLFNPLKEIYKPIPEDIILQLVSFAQDFMSVKNKVAPYKNLPQYDEEVLGNTIHTLSMTGSDTPTVQRFYERLLPLWKDNRKTYYDKYSGVNIESLGAAIAQLGENGSQFIPFINKKIIEEREALSNLEKSIDPESRQFTNTKNLLQRAYKKIEKLFYIKKAIDPQFGKSNVYKWYKRNIGWYKKAQQQYLWNDDPELPYANTPQPSSNTENVWEPSGDIEEDVDECKNLEQLNMVLNAYGILDDIEEIDFPNGSSVWVFDKGDQRLLIYLSFPYPKIENAKDWVENIGENAWQYVNERDFNQEFWESAGKGTILYHGTSEENAKNILREGLDMRDETRGISNRSVGAAVFTSYNPEAIEAYGDIIIAIDIGEMKKDGYMPIVEPEGDVDFGQYQEALAHLIGIKDYYYEYEQGIDQETIVFNSTIPAKYLSLYKE